VCLAALGDTHEVQLQQMLRPGQPVSLSHLLTSEPWGAIAVLALLVGIVLEVARRRAAAVVNCAYYVIALAGGIWDLEG
jgi:uncharacterized membrane protein YqjE